MTGLRVISYGGGVQSTAMIVLATQGRIDAEVGLFANVGDDSEHPGTLTYVRDVMIPWAAERGFPVHELHRVMRDGTARTLMEDLTRDSRTINIPVRMANGAPGNRNCTHTYKVQTIGKWLKAHGATADNPATVNIGISTDEIQRVGNKKVLPYEQPAYPLIELGLDRGRCAQVIADAGLPVPGKSACFFCPFHRPATWSVMARDEPELFAKSADLEDLLNERRRMLGKDEVWLTRFARPLREAVHPAQDTLPGLSTSPATETCDDGFCWT